MRSSSFALALIAFGVGFLLYNLRIITFTPWELLWPGFVIWLGFSQLTEAHRRRDRGDNSTQIVIGLILITIGTYLLLPVIGIRVPSIPWRTVWPLALILIGLFRLLPGKMRFKVPGVIINLNPGGENRRFRETRTSLIGEFKRGPGNWVLEDMNLRHGIGSVYLDLTQAIIPDREVFIDVSGYAGEATIYLPPALPYKIECSLNLGEVTVLDINESGSGRHVETKSADYDTASRKVNIRVHWKVGEVSIHQIR